MWTAHDVRGWMDARIATGRADSDENVSILLENGQQDMFSARARTTPDEAIACALTFASNGDRDPRFTWVPCADVAL